jgi:hypothetical protein
MALYWGIGPRRPRVIGLLALIALVVMLLMSVGCSSPAAPSVPEYGVAVDARVANAWALARTMPAAAWTKGQSVAVWLDRLPVVALEVRQLPSGISGQYDIAKRTIVVNVDVLASDTAVIAATLLHEARHAEGYDHTCGGNDRTFNEMGAWAVNALALELLGRDATGIRTHQFCQ